MKKERNKKRTVVYAGNRLDLCLADKCDVGDYFRKKCRTDVAAATEEYMKKNEEEILVIWTKEGERIGYAYIRTNHPEKPEFYIYDVAFMNEKLKGYYGRKAMKYVIRYLTEKTKHDEGILISYNKISVLMEDFWEQNGWGKQAVGYDGIKTVLPE